LGNHHQSPSHTQQSAGGSSLANHHQSLKTNSTKTKPKSSRDSGLSRRDSISSTASSSTTSSSSVSTSHGAPTCRWAQGDRAFHFPMDALPKSHDNFGWAFAQYSTKKIVNNEIKRRRYYYCLGVHSCRSCDFVT
jgi:hypothetical protein